MTEDQERTDLFGRVTAASRAYYEGTPVMDDFAFDALAREYEQKYGALPIASGYVPESKKVTHSRPMLSLGKVHSMDEVESWLDRLGLEPGEPLEVQPKYDGGALSLTYVDGKLVRAASRGNGLVGEDVTAKAREVPSIPHRCANPLTFEVRGEIVITHGDWAKLSTDFPGKYKHQRNAANGIIRSSSTGDGKYLTFIPYDWYADGSPSFGGFGVWHDFVFPETVLNPSADFDKAAFRWTYGVDPLEDLERKLLFYTEHNIGVLNDGAVLKVMAADTKHRLGSGRKSPNWAVAYKFESRPETTTLREIEWNVGRTRRLNPTAVFDPIDFDGAVTTRATMHAAAEIIENGYEVGKRVVLVRANEVIPYIVGLAAGEEPADVKLSDLPTECPRCGSLTEMDGAYLMCTSARCNPSAELLHALTTLGVKGVSTSFLEKFLESDLVADDASLPEMLTDLACVTAEQVLTLPGFKETSAKNAVAALDTVWHAYEDSWLAALGVPKIGRTQSAALIAHFGSLADVAAGADESALERLQSIDGIGPGRAAQVISANGLINGLVLLLGEIGLRPAVRERVSVAESDRTEFFGKNVVVTGTVDGWTRTSISEKLAELGATVQSSVSKTTDILIAGEKAGSKLAKAESLGVAVVTGGEWCAAVA